MSDDYYFAGDKKIPLTKDEHHIGLDFDHPAVKELGAKVMKTLRQHANFLKKGIALLPRETIAEELIENLDAADATLPVFDENNVLLVVLPEVRVELDDAAQIDSIRSYLESEDAADIKEKSGRISFVPRSRSGSDALRMSNQIHEKLKAKLSQARFLRVVPRTKR